MSIYQRYFGAGTVPFGYHQHQPVELVEPSELGWQNRFLPVRQHDKTFGDISVQAILGNNVQQLDSRYNYVTWTALTLALRLAWLLTTPT